MLLMQIKGTFGTLVRERRAGAGMTLGALAGILGISVPYLSDIELGRRNPFDAARMKILGEALGIDLAELEKAAAVSRGVFELEAGPTPLHVDVAAELAEVWPRLTSGDLTAIREELRGGSLRRSRKADR